jgi:hypothetical protein
MTLPVLIFDSDCSFCTASANRVAAPWRGGARAVPWQALAAWSAIASRPPVAPDQAPPTA